MNIPWFQGTPTARAVGLEIVTASNEEPLPCAGEIFLWCLDLRRLDLVPLLPFLSVAECRVASMGKRFGTDLEERLKARGALRGILSACTGQPALSFAIACRRGREGNLAHNPLGLQFSVSRSCEHALIGIGRAPLSIDIEAVRPDCAWQMIAAHWFHPSEQAHIAAAPAAEQRDVFFQIWAHKEAFIKGAGIGLDRDAIMSCATMPEGRITGGGSWPAGSSWHLQSLKAPPGYKASLATSGKTPCIIDRTASFARTLAFACPRHFPERSRTIMNIPDALPQPATGVGTMSC
jgi:phosphopantetheinyl transferase